MEPIIDDKILKVNSNISMPTLNKLLTASKINDKVAENKPDGGDMSDLNTLISAHWQAQVNLAHAKEAERKARDELSNFLCNDAEGLRNHTMTLSGDYKLKHEVLRTLRINKSHEDYKNVPHILTPEQLNALVNRKEVIEFRYGAFNKLPEDIKSELSKFVTVNEAVTIKYEQSTDNR